jgi:hypothetical protein
VISIVEQCSGRNTGSSKKNAERRSLGRYSSLGDTGHGVFIIQKIVKHIEMIRVLKCGESYVDDG